MYIEIISSYILAAINLTDNKTEPIKRMEKAILSAQSREELEKNINDNILDFLLELYK